MITRKSSLFPDLLSISTHYKSLPTTFRQNGHNLPPIFSLNGVDGKGQTTRQFNIRATYAQYQHPISAAKTHGKNGVIGTSQISTRQKSTLIMPQNKPTSLFLKPYQQQLFKV